MRASTRYEPPLGTGSPTLAVSGEFHRVTADAVLLSQSNDLFEVLAPTESVSAGHNDDGGFFDLLLVHRGHPQLFSLAYIANNDEAGASFRDLAKVNVLLTRAADVAAMNALYAGAFGPAPYPARTTCVVQALPNPAMLIEIECVASLAGR